ncbi:hypothetical protein [Fusarium redolens polymycovirus 1]|uniref:Uncharacterized protein n=1 Tax=Fusarium redolens polymycovirus 1 TaxID=2546034 RepID=A0A513ZVF0_9VIRU|nr:hypothetical protein KM555_s8gp1 [Fusarium redolens polymycovirus 1]QDH44664.1 hypothetical protein [Fusarium redolens polymycovirus 1]
MSDRDVTVCCATKSGNGGATTSWGRVCCSAEEVFSCCSGGECRSGHDGQSPLRIRRDAELGRDCRMSGRLGVVSCDRVACHDVSCGPAGSPSIRDSGARWGGDIRGGCRNVVCAPGVVAAIPRSTCCVRGPLSSDSCGVRRRGPEFIHQFHTLRRSQAPGAGADRERRGGSWLKLISTPGETGSIVSLSSQFFLGVVPVVDDGIERELRGREGGRAN